MPWPIWQDMVTEYGYSGGYQTVQRFIGKLRGSQGPEPVGIITTAPGEESQVDYGTGPMVRDAQTGQVPADATIRDDAGLQPQSGSIIGIPFEQPHVGPSCMKRPFVGWVAAAGSWFSIT